MKLWLKKKIVFVYLFFYSGGPRHMSHYRDLDRPNDEEFWTNLELRRNRRALILLLFNLILDFIWPTPSVLSSFLVYKFVDALMHIHFFHFVNQSSIVEIVGFLFVLQKEP
jgi:hypothetical protein